MANKVDIPKLYTEYTQQKLAKDDRQYLTLSKIKFEEGRNEYFGGNYHKAVGLFLEFRDVSSQIIALLQRRSQSAHINESIVTSKTIVSDRLSYLISSYILDQNIWPKNHDIAHLRQALLKAHLATIGNLKLSIEEQNRIIDAGIALTIRNWPNRFVSFEAEDDKLLIDQLTSLDTMDALRLKRHLAIAQLQSLKSGNFTGSDVNYSYLSGLYGNIAELTQTIDNGLLTSSYFENMADHYLYSLFATENLKDFWKLFPKFTSSLDEYIDQEFNSEQSIRHKYLDTAYALSHALRLSEKLEDKITISKQIVDLFSSAKSYNSVRFKVYQHWFESANTFLEAKPKNLKDITELWKLTATLSSVKYVDRDLEYIQATNPEIKSTQAYLVQLVKYLQNLILVDRPNNPLHVQSLDSALLLYKEHFLDLQSAFEILKRYIEREVKISVSPEPLHLVSPGTKDENVFQKFIDAGESDSVEFKSSWWYDLNVKKRNDDIRYSCLRAIASMMNSAGGLLFIGVGDAGNILGLEDTDFVVLDKNQRKRLDQLKLLIDNAVSQFIGTNYNSFIKVSFQHSDEQTYVVVTIERSTTPAWLYRNNKTEAKLFIRASASSMELVGNEISEYLSRNTA